MKTLENYKFETNTNPGENLLGFIQGANPTIYYSRWVL